MSVVRDQELKANETHAKAFGDQFKLAMPAARRFAMLSCDLRRPFARTADALVGRWAASDFS